MDFEFDRMPKPQGTNSLFRRIVIFSVVLAVTGGIIYWIVPHQKPSVATVAPANEKAAEPVAPTQTETQVSEKKSVDAPAVAKTAPEEVTQTEMGSPSQDVAGKTPTAKPIKGVPWQGDPAVDAPIKLISAETAEAEQKQSADNWAQVERGGEPWCIRYAVGRGDNLEKLANRHHTTVALIKEMNHLKGNTIFLGRKLILVPGPWQIEVSKSARRLQLYNLAKGKTLFAAYDVGIGRADTTPAEKFVISIRVYHPDYRAPNGAVYAYGEPENPMGDYFLKLAKAAQQNRPLAGYGIHGSPNDAGIGKSLSHGCVRMRNQDVRQLYLLCPVGTPVSIAE